MLRSLIPNTCDIYIYTYICVCEYINTIFMYILHSRERMIYTLPNNQPLIVLVAYGGIVHPSVVLLAFGRLSAGVSQPHH